VEFQLPGARDGDARFQEVAGLGAELGLEEVVEGGENRFSHRCRNGIENFDFAPTTVNVTLLNENHEPLAETYSFIRAWPVKWSVSDFKAQENGLVIETLELAFNYFTRSKLG
jgi:hypothetical protein